MGTICNDIDRKEILLDAHLEDITPVGKRVERDSFLARAPKRLKLSKFKLGSYSGARRSLFNEVGSSLSKCLGRAALDMTYYPPDESDDEYY